MKVLELELTNFGPHSHLKIENIDGNVIGLIGVNGSGKSHIVNAIKALLLGDLPEGSSTFVKTGEDMATVSGILEINGHKCKIIRTWGKKNSRKLWVDHFDCEPITKSKDVTAEIETLLGVDKTTAANTLIIAQNEIQNILKCGEAKRIELFVKWLNLGFINKHFDFINDKIKELSKQTVSVNPLKEAVKAEETKKEFFVNELNKKQQELDEKYVSEDTLVRINSLAEKYMTDSHQLSVCLENKKQAEQKISILEEERIRNSIPELSVIEKELQSITQSISDSQSKQLVLKQNLRLLEDSIRILKTNENYYESLEEQLDLFVVNPKAIVEQEALEYCITFYKHFYAVKDLTQKLKDYVALETTPNDVIDSYQKNQEEQADLVSKIQKTLVTLDHVSDQIKKRVVTITKIKQMPNLAFTCDSCGSSISINNIAHLEDQVVALEKQKQELESEKTELFSKKLALDEVIFKQKSQMEYNTNCLLRQKQLVELATAKSKTSLDKLYKQYDALKDKSNFRYEKDDLPEDFTLDPDNTGEYLSEDISLWYSDNLKKHNTWVKLHEQFNEIKSIEDIEKQCEVLRLELTQLESNRDSLQERATQLVTLQKEAERIKTLLNSYYYHLEDLEFKLTELNLEQHSFVNFINDLKTTTTNVQKQNLKLEGAFSDIIKTVKTAVGEYFPLAELRTKIRLCDELINEKNQLINKLENENEKLYKKLLELSQIAEATNPKKGIMQDYLQYLFKFVVNRASEYLTIWDSNFIIKLNEDEGAEALSVKFLRTDRQDDPNNCWLPMSKLSGGQGMRLAISFLMSVQSIICPGLNFLVLDEPSTNLDEGGVKSLAFLLERLSEDGSNSETGQLWIVDHQKELERAFTTKIELC